MDIYERLKFLCNEKGVSVSKMEIDNGFPKGNSNKWRKSVPSADKLLKLSEYFGVSTDYILTGEQDELSKDKLHSDPEIAEMVNTVARIPEAKIFLSAIKDMPKEDLETITALVRKMAH